MTGEINALVVGIFFGCVVGFMLCLFVMFFMGIIGEDLKEFIDASLEELVKECKRIGKWK
jgi:hypothetical protein